MTAVTPATPLWRRRWVWIFLGGWVVGGTLVFALLLTAPVQGWLLRRIVASHPGWKVDFQKFGAGFGGIDVRGLEFSMPGVHAKSEPIAIRIAPGQLLNRRELRIERAEAHQLLVTITPAEFAATPPAAEPFEGVMRLLQFPIAWALDDTQLDGEIAVREGGQSIVVGAF